MKSKFPKDGFIAAEKGFDMPEIVRYEDEDSQTAKVKKRAKKAVKRVIGK